MNLFIIQILALILLWDFLSNAAFPTFHGLTSPHQGRKPLQNKLTINVPCSDVLVACPDFHVVGYYLNEHKASLIMRRLDKIFWDFSLSIYISDDCGNGNVSARKEPVELTPSNSSTITIVVETKISLCIDKRLYQHQQIPKSIIQTHYSSNASSLYHWNAYHTFVDLNPEYSHVLMTDRQNRNFIRKYYPSFVLNAYDLLVANAYKADLFRYCYLYIMGGCYFDNKMILRKPLREVIQPNDTLLVCSDVLPYGKAPKSLSETSRLYNAVICAQSRDERMLKVIHYVVRQITEKSTWTGALSLTGPAAFYNALTRHGALREENVRFKHGISHMESFSLFRAPSENQRVYTDYYVIDKGSGERFLTKFYQGFQRGSTRYGELWKQGEIFYSGPLLLGAWKLFHFPDVAGNYAIRYGNAAYLEIEKLHRPSLDLALGYEVVLGKDLLGAGDISTIKFVVVNDETSSESRFSVDVRQCRFDRPLRVDFRLP